MRPAGPEAPPTAGELVRACGTAHSQRHLDARCLALLVHVAAAYAQELVVSDPAAAVAVAHLHAGSRITSARWLGAGRRPDPERREIRRSLSSVSSGRCSLVRVRYDWSLGPVIPNGVFACWKAVHVARVLHVLGLHGTACRASALRVICLTCRPVRRLHGASCRMAYGSCCKLWTLVRNPAGSPA